MLEALDGLIGNKTIIAKAALPLPPCVANALLHANNHQSVKRNRKSGAERLVACRGLRKRAPFLFDQDGLHQDTQKSLTECGVDLQWSARTTWLRQPC